MSRSVRHLSVGQRDDLVPFLVRGLDPHQGGVAVLVANAQQRAVRGIEGQVADARVPHQHPRRPVLQVQRHQVAKGDVVGGVEEGPGLRVERRRGDLVLHRPLDVDQPSHAAVGQRDRADVRDHARIEEAADHRAVGRIDIGLGDGSEGPRADPTARGKRELPHRLEVGFLELVFPGDPFAPRGRQGFAEHPLELVAVVAIALLAPAEPLDDLFGRVHEPEVAEEAGAVEIRRGHGLEIGGRAGRHHAQRAVEMRVVADHGAEHHFVVAALGATYASRQPGLHEYGRTFGMPARARCGGALPGSCREWFPDARRFPSAFRRRIFARKPPSGSMRPSWRYGRVHGWPASGIARCWAWSRRRGWSVRVRWRRCSAATPARLRCRSPTDPSARRWSFRRASSGRSASGIRASSGNSAPRTASGRFAADPGTAAGVPRSAVGPAPATRPMPGGRRSQGTAPGPTCTRYRTASPLSPLGACAEPLPARPYNKKPPAVRRRLVLFGDVPVSGLRRVSGRH